MDMTGESPKRRMFDQFARMAKALGHAHRLELLEALAQGERSVDGLARATRLSMANTSQHLQHLRGAGLVTSRKDGLHVRYRLTGDDVVALLGALQDTAQRHLAEVEQVVQGYYTARDRLEPVSREDLLARLEDGTVTVLDVRPPREFAAGHVRGAINIPLEDLERRLAEFPPDREVVAYCRGAWCVLAFEAVSRLRERGVPARRLEDGLPEWRAAGLPVSRTDRHS